jgi:hypothetical protein
VGRDARSNASDLPDVTSGIFFIPGLDMISVNQKWFARRVEFVTLLADVGQRIGCTNAQATAGGLASVAGGGKFANGAITAAFQYKVAHGDSAPGRVLINSDLVRLAPIAAVANDAIGQKRISSRVSPRSQSSSLMTS